MTVIIAALIIPEEVPSLLAILGLLFCWELHDVLIHQGRDGKITDHDHLALRLLSAMLLEETNPQAAHSWYRQALAQATKGNHTLICAAAYLRSVEFLEQSGYSKDALQVTRNFFREFTEKTRDCFLTKPQYHGMVARQNRMIRSLLYSSNRSGNWPR